jgi:hypothetical protein
MKRFAFNLHIITLIYLFLSLSAHAATPSLPAGFKAEVLASGLNQPKGLTSALFRAGAGPFGHDLYVAESGANRVVRVDKSGSGATAFANTGNFPVGVALYGGPFAQYLYVGNAFSGDGIDRVDSLGNTTDFALNGTGVTGLDFGRGRFGHYLYAGVWTQGEIHKVDGAGNASLFSSKPGTQTRYLKFSHGNKFGHYLYYTDFNSGNIYRVDHKGNVSLFAQTNTSGLEGLDFAPGGAFGHYLYVGSLSTGEIFKVDRYGNVELWADGFDGAADIHFQPGKCGSGFTMYMVDGHSQVYAISSVKKKHHHKKKVSVKLCFAGLS